MIKSNISHHLYGFTDLKSLNERGPTVLSHGKGMVDLAIDEISLNHIHKLHGVQVKESNIREEYNLIIVGLVNGDGSYEINPDPDAILNENHTLMLMGQKEKLDLFKETFRKQ